MFDRRRFARPLALLPILVVVLAAVSPAGVRAQATQDTTRLPEALRETRAKFNDAITRRDAAAAAPCFAEDAVVNFGGEVYTGRESVVNNWLAPTLGALMSLRIGGATFTVAEDEVVETASHGVDAGDGSGEQAGSHVVHWKRMPDGSWLVAKLEVHG
jgi:ketosteroid isomerase-like protein